MPATSSFSTTFELVNGRKHFFRTQQLSFRVVFGDGYVDLGFAIALLDAFESEFRLGAEFGDWPLEEARGAVLVRDR